MHISLVGVNHNTAPVAVREKVAIPVERLGEALSRLRSYLPEGVVLSTCNRTEVYAIDDGGRHADKACLSFLEGQLDIPNIDLRKYIYTAVDEAAVEHLFRVACGLDSMILGEFEVLGQVRQALEAAEKAGMVSLPLRHVFQNAVRMGRKVREETGISRNPVSASSVAVDLAAEAVGELSGCRLLVIGAGDAGRLVAKAARDRGLSDIIVANRTRERAEDLARKLGGVPLGLEEMLGELADVDVVVGCSGAPHWILGAHHVEAAMKKRPDRPMVIIDIAVPRDVEPAVADIANVFLHNIDSLTRIAQANRQQREADLDKVAQIIAAEVDKFSSWWQTYEVRPVIRALMSKAEDIRCHEMARTLKRLRPLSEEEHYSVDAMTRSIVAKLLQEPIQCLKVNAGRKSDYARAVSELFGLNGEKQA